MTRRFFQIHLLTAVVGMLAAAGFVGVNLRQRSVDAICMMGSSKQGTQVYATPYFELGWPGLMAERRGPAVPFLILSNKEKSGAVQAQTDKVAVVQVASSSYEQLKSLGRSGLIRGYNVRTWQDVLHDIPEVRSSAPNAYPRNDGEALPRGDLHFYWPAVAWNAAVAMVIVMVVMIGIEWYLRRREGEKI